MSLLHLHLWECELFLTLGDLRGCFCFFWVFFWPTSGSIPTPPLIRRMLNLRISQPLCGSLELSQCSSLFPTLCLLNRKAWASPDSLTGQQGFWALPGFSLPFYSCCCSTAIMSNSLQPHGLQHTRLHCPSPSPRACSNSCPSSWWCHPTISSSVVPFSSHLQSFPASGFVFSNELALRIKCPKYWSFNFSISASSEYSGLISFRIDWFDLLAVHGTLKSLLQHHSSKALFFGTQPSWSNSHIHPWLLENHSFDYTDFCQQSNISAFWYAKLVMAFFPRSRRLLIMVFLLLMCNLWHPYIFSKNSWICFLIVI